MPELIVGIRANPQQYFFVEPFPRGDVVMGRLSIASSFSAYLVPHKSNGKK
jgi:hypothetical protein